jgi:hypothetical protein
VTLFPYTTLFRSSNEITVQPAQVQVPITLQNNNTNLNQPNINITVYNVLPNNITIRTVIVNAT